MSLQEQHLDVRLAAFHEELAREFPSVPRSEIETSVSIVENQLRASTRMIDYAPVFVLRFARERLHARRDETLARAA
jgi:hypothetical protein